MQSLPDYLPDLLEIDSRRRFIDFCNRLGWLSRVQDIVLVEERISDANAIAVGNLYGSIGERVLLRGVWDGNN